MGPGGWAPEGGPRRVGPGGWALEGGPRWALEGGPWRVVPGGPWRLGPGGWAPEGGPRSALEGVSTQGPGVPGVGVVRPYVKAAMLPIQSCCLVVPRMPTTMLICWVKYTDPCTPETSNVIRRYNRVPQYAPRIPPVYMGPVVLHNQVIL